MCDHKGNYSIYTRVAGYSRTRVYSCHVCGAQMALDTLPQYLLRRMFGEVVPAADAEGLVPIDLCIVFSGVIAPELARVFFWSLKQTTCLEGVTLHLVNIDVPNFGSVADLAPLCTVYLRPSVPISMHRSDWLGVDAEWSSNWTVEHCGSEKFVALVHFDLFFFRDFLTLLRQHATETTGMLGQHCPFVLLNRDAYAKSCFKFRSAGPFTLVPREGNDYYMYCLDDPRATGTLQTGFDNGELLELELRMAGWNCDPMREHFDNYFYHFSGGGRVLGGPELDSLFKRVQMFTEEYIDA